MRRYLPEWLRRAFHRVGIGLGSSSGSAPPFEPSHEHGLIAWYRASDTKAYDQPCLVDGNMEEASCVTQPALVDGDMELAPPASPTIADADMEAADCSAWPTVGSGARSKSATTPHSGTQCLRLTDDGVNNYCAVYQIILTAGHTYRITGWGRSDGTALPRVHDGATYVWVGSTSTDWQPIDATFVAGATQLRLYATGLAAGAGNYADFDDLSIEDLTATAWVASQATTVPSKQTGTPHAGTYCLRVYVGAAYGTVNQACTTIGRVYRARGWARGDGSHRPWVSVSSSTDWAGTSSTDWQYFDITAKSANGVFYLGCLDASGYVEFDGVTLEDLTAGAWSAANAVISKRSESPHSGSRCLRVAYDGSHAAGSAYQTIVSGAMYRAKGWARGDGTSSPIVVWSGAPDWSGTTSTDWQYFDKYATAGSAYFQLESTNLSTGHHVEFDDVTIERVYLADGDCEASGTSYWGTSQVVVSKQADPYAGTQCLRVAHDGSHTWGGATQTVLTIGQAYRLRGYYRSSDGVAQLYVADSGAQWLVNGGGETTWTAFDLIRKASGTVLNIGASELSAGQYLEFDSVTLEPAFVVDGDMEAADCSAWTAYQAVLSKEGSVGSRVLRVSYDGVNAAGLAYQSYLTTGQCYRVRGRARGDGVCAPSLLIGFAVENWSGTPSTDWQDIDVCGVASDDILRLQCNNLSSGSYVEYDDITVECISASAFVDRSGHTRNCNQASAAKQFGVIPDQLNGRPVARFDGVDDFCQALFPQGQPVWGLIVAKMTFAAGSTVLLDGSLPDPSNQLYNNAGTTDLVLYCGAGLTKSGASSDTWTVIDYLANGASSGLGLNGGTWATGNAGATAANGITLGASASGALPATVDIAEAFFFDHAPDVETRRRAVNYCKREYGL